MSSLEDRRSSPHRGEPEKLWRPVWVIVFAALVWAVPIFLPVWFIFRRFW